MDDEAIFKHIVFQFFTISLTTLNNEIRNVRKI